MSRIPDEPRTPSSGDAARPGRGTGVRKPYASPKLVDYGTVAKLTQGPFSGNIDAMGTMRRRRRRMMMMR